MKLFWFSLFLEIPASAAHFPAHKSSSSPSSPKSPSARSPTEERRMRIPAENGKQVVHRSNSSPEMESWKYSYVNQQNLIREQDEEDQGKGDDVFSPGEKGLGGGDISVSTGSGYKSGLNSHMTKGGTTSPYRGSYEAIPEEVIHKDGVVPPPPANISTSPTRRERIQFQTQHSNEERGSSKVKDADPGLGLTPMKRDRINTVSVMSGPHARNLRRILSAGSGDTGSKLRRDSEFGTGHNESLYIRSGMSPGFVFLQIFGREVKPLLVPASMEKSIKVCLLARQYKFPPRRLSKVFPLLT